LLCIRCFAFLECAIIPSPDPLRGEVEFVKELPKTISDKIKRKVLRTMEFERKREVIEQLKEKGLWLRSD